MTLGVRIKRSDTESLHGPWDDEAPDPDADALAKLRDEFGDTWRIWRSVTAQQVPGNWCAHRLSTTNVSRSVTATTADELRTTLELSCSSGLHFPS
ncbi:hypothetical protein [Nocardiopsis dassonvillei]|uniref:hypothetical protein n=1 Tax=Nocardiopsis dassonvillei TaxID=2014 RepID=UPI00362E504A